MPKLKEAAKLDIPQNVMDNIEWYMSKQGIPVVEMADYMGFSRATYFNRKRHPGELTLKELALASRKLGVPMRVLEYGSIQDIQDSVAV